MFQDETFVLSELNFYTETDDGLFIHKCIGRTTYSTYPDEPSMHIIYYSGDFRERRGYTQARLMNKSMESAKRERIYIYTLSLIHDGRYTSELEHVCRS